MSSRPAPAPAAADPFAGLTVASVMHPGVLSAPADAPLSALAAIMAAHQVHAVVLAETAPANVVSDLDLLAAAVAGDEQARAGRSGRALPVLGPRTPLAAAVAVMADADAAHVLVRDAHTDVPVGMLSSFDVVAVLGGHDPRAAGLPRPRPARPSLSESRLDHVLVRDVMHAGLVAVAPETPLRQLAATLAQHRVHCASVAGTTASAAGERLIWAIAADMDVVRAAVAGELEATAGQIAATEPLSVAADDRLDTVAARMVEHGVRHAVVGSAREPAAGAVSTLDIVGVLGAGSAW